mgnify:FL=1
MTEQEARWYGVTCSLCGFEYKEFNQSIIPCPLCKVEALQAQLAQAKSLHQQNLELQGIIIEANTLENNLRRQIKLLEDNIAEKRNEYMNLEVRHQALLKQIHTCSRSRN